MADSFNPDFLISSGDYAGVMDAEVLPYLASRRTVHTLTAPDGVSLWCAVYGADAPAGTVLVLHGFTENEYKYAEVIHSLLRSGFSVVAFDQRGHGRSGRDSAIQDPSVTHVGRFQDYVSDLDLVCGRLLAPLPKPHMIFAHSMGGAVAALYLESHPGVFDAAALCAPMIAPNTGGLPAFLTKAVCGAAKLIGREKHHPFFMKPYSGPEDFESSCATDPVRFAWYDAIKAARPEFRNSVPTYGWTLEAVGVTRAILAPGAPEKIGCPVLLSSADRDSSVLPEPQKRLIERVPRGRRIFVPGSRHEIFRSVNEVFFPWWSEVLAFLKSAGRAA